MAPEEQVRLETKRDKQDVPDELPALLADLQMLAHLLDRLGRDLLHSVEEQLEVIQRLFLDLALFMDLSERLGLEHGPRRFCARLRVLSGAWGNNFVGGNRLLLVPVVPRDDLLDLLDHHRVFLPDQVERQRTLDVREVLAQLPRHVRVQLLECRVHLPQFVSWKFQFSEHLLHAQIVDIFAVKVDHARVDQEAFLQSVVLDDFRHLLVLHEQALEFLVQCLFEQRAENPVDRLHQLFILLRVDFRLVLRYQHHTSLLLELAKNLACKKVVLDFHPELNAEICVEFRLLLLTG